MWRRGAGDLRIPFPQRLRRPHCKGRKVKRAAAAGQISPGRSRQRRDPGDPSGHVGPHERLCAKASSARIGNYVYDKAPEGAGAGKHDHVVFETDAPARIIFNDHRRFGLMTLVETEHAGRGQAVQGYRHRAPVARLQHRLSGQGAGRQEDADQVGAAGPAAGGGPGQYLCLRGAVPRRHLAQAAGGRDQDANDCRRWWRRSRKC